MNAAGIPDPFAPEPRGMRAAIRRYFARMIRNLRYRPPPRTRDELRRDAADDAWLGRYYANRRDWD